MTEDKNLANDPTVDLQTTEHGEADNLDMQETTAFAADVESPSSEGDAGIHDITTASVRQSRILGATNADEEMGASNFEDDGFDGNIDADLPGSPIEEIPMSNVDIESMDDPIKLGIVRSPDDDAPNVPGDVDIEGLDEDALDLTDLPADARLDPLED
jgi:hypothetical protein